MSNLWVSGPSAKCCNNVGACTTDESGEVSCGNAYSNYYPDIITVDPVFTDFDCGSCGEKTRGISPVAPNGTVYPNRINNFNYPIRHVPNGHQLYQSRQVPVDNVDNVLGPGVCHMPNPDWHMCNFGQKKTFGPCGRPSVNPVRLKARVPTPQIPNRRLIFNYPQPRPTCEEPPYNYHLAMPDQTETSLQGTKEGFVSGRYRKQNRCGCTKDSDDYFCGCQTNSRPIIDIHGSNYDLYRMVKYAEDSQVYPIALTPVLKGYRAFGRKELKKPCDESGRSMKYQYRPPIESEDYRMCTDDVYDNRFQCS